MTEKRHSKVAIVSTFLPRKCGIATFTSDLIKYTSSAAKGEFDPLVVAMNNENIKYKDPVKFEIRQNVKSDYICAADYLNFSHVDVVSVQHEFGLFGGEAGCYLNLLLKRVNAPVITTLHTVLNDPSEVYRKGLVDVCRESYKIVVMNEKGVGMLKDIYGIDEKKIELIAHGIPDLPFVDNNYYKHRFGMEGRRTILTFGLLSKNKGIEVMLRAMPEIVKADPSVLYIILGMTHPSVLKHDGESYRFGLQKMVKDLGCSKNVIFFNRFVTDEELRNFLCASDIYVTPYLNEEQLTSGTLSFAVGTGKAVVSTPYWAACELLADERGKLVDFGDHKQLANAVIEILKNDELFYTLRRKAYDYGRSRTWTKAGEAYLKLFSASGVPLCINTNKTSLGSEAKSSFNIPEARLDHVMQLSDDTGILQHAKLTIPDREHGYCTDDNARAVIAINKYYKQYPEPEILKMLDKYISFVLHSQNGDGSVRNFMDYSRKWVRNEPASDALGRVIWSLGSLIADPPAESYLSIIKDRFDMSIAKISKQSIRGQAYSIIGMADYLKQFPGASDIKRQMIDSADRITASYYKHSNYDWQWFENKMTYDNAMLSYSMLIAGKHFGEKYLEIGINTCDFLLDNTYTNSHFSFIGCDGWYPRGEAKAEFDQQPLEATSTILMLKAAYEITEDHKYIILLRKAFDWYLGDNDNEIALYNFRTKGCFDGLEQCGVNLNQGAESVLSFLISLLTVVEVGSLFDRIDETELVNFEKNYPQQVTIKKQTQKKIPVKEILKKRAISQPKNATGF